LARKTDHLADLEADDTGGVLSNLLAEEDELDRRALWRLGSWGVGATAAVVLAVMANQSSLGLKQDQVAAADIARQAQQIQSVAKETHNEARRLAAAIDTLNSDRDRLYSRVTSLEHGLDSVTGAIARQGSITVPAPVANVEPHTVQNPAPGPAPAVATVATTQAVAPAADKPAASAAAEPGPAPVSSAPKDTAKTDSAKEIAKADAARNSFAKTEISKTEISKTEISKTEISKAELSKTEIAKAEIAKPDAAKPETAKADTARTEVAKTTPAPPPRAAPLIIAPPEPAAARLIESTQPPGSVIAGPLPEVVASAPSTSDAEAEEDGAPKIALQRTEFGVDLGSANSVNGLRALWLGLVKSRSNAPLAALRPIIVVKEGANGLGMQLRLVAGPLNDAGAAARICAVMTENKRFCETTIFDGQRLLLKSADALPAAEKPAPRRHSFAKRAPAPVTVEEPPKKPEPTSTLSSMFGRKNSQ
jgi:hypothetical protein